MFKNIYLYLFLSVLLVLSFIISISFGSVSIDRITVLKTLFDHIYLPNNSIPLTSTDVIVWTHRLPRVLLACISGMGLAMIGVVLQAIIKNPLADPQLLGVSSGASVGAVFSIIIGLNSIFGEFSTTLMAFIGGLLAFLTVLMIANYNNRLTPLRLILSGTSISFFCTSVTSFLSLKANNITQIKSIQFWLLGGLSGTTWDQIPLASVIILVIGIIFYFSSRYLNALSMGDDTAASLGINTKVFRIFNIVLCAMGIAVIVANCGNIGFVGLVIPHIVRLMVGADNQRVLPISILLGGIFLTLCDLLSRILISPEELPIGIITSFIGAPFFVWLILRDKNTL